MATCQYRKGGGGDILLYRRYQLPTSWPLVGGLGFWWKVMNFTSLKYHHTDKMMEHMDKVIDSVRTIESLTTDQKQIEAAIASTKQDNPFYSDPLEMSVPKNAKKFKGRRGDPRKDWEKVVNFVRSWHGPSTNKTMMYQMAKPSAAATVDKVGVVTQPVGRPVNPNQSRKGGGNNQQSMDCSW